VPTQRDDAAKSAIDAGSRAMRHMIPLSRTDRTMLQAIAVRAMPVNTVAACEPGRLLRSQVKKPTGRPGYTLPPPLIILISLATPVGYTVLAVGAVAELSWGEGAETVELPD
jgi:hypothetical protein